MLRIYRVTAGLVVLIAIWAAALRSSLEPSQHLAVLLVSASQDLSRLRYPQRTHQLG